MIELHKAVFTKKDKFLTKKCLDSEWLSSSGKNVSILEKKIIKYTGINNCIAVLNGSVALYLSIYSLKPGYGDEIIVPTLTFVATVNSVILNNCSPVFQDCDSFFNIDVDKTIEFLRNQTIQVKKNCVNKKTNKKIFAIIVTSTWGNHVDLSRLKEICLKKNIKIIEDSAEALGTFSNQKKHAGFYADISIISFNLNKIITGGGGGAILTNNTKLAKNINHIANQAKKNKKLFIHDQVGFNFKMNNVNATLCLSQLKRINQIKKKKIYINKLYENSIMSKNFNVAPRPNADNNNWMNILIFKNFKNFKMIKRLINQLEKYKIETRPVWKLNHKQSSFKNFQAYKITNADKLYNSSLCIPSGINLKKKKIDFIIKVIKNILNEK